MKMVDYYIDKIKDEMSDSLHYAEKYIEYKQMRPTFAKYYKEMGENELLHASYIKDMGQQAIDEVKYTYISDDDMEHWTKCMKKYADGIGIIRTMLNS